MSSPAYSADVKGDHRGEDMTPKRTDAEAVNLEDDPFIKEWEENYFAEKEPVTPKPSDAEAKDMEVDVLDVSENHCALKRAALDPGDAEVKKKKR